METTGGGPYQVQWTGFAAAIEAWRARHSPRAALAMAEEVLGGEAVAEQARGVARATVAVARLALEDPAGALEAMREVPALLTEASVAGMPELQVVLTEGHLTALRAASLLDDVAAATRWGREALALAQRYSLPQLAATAHNDLAAVYGSREILDVAIKHLQSGIATLEDAGLPVAPTLLTNLGNVYLGTGRIDEGLACFKLGREAFQAAEDRFGAALARSNEGRANGKLGQHDLAVEALEEALAEFKELENERYVSVTSAKLAEAHAAAGDGAVAERYFQEALAARGGRADSFEAEIRESHGRYLLGAQQPEPALLELRRALELFVDSGRHIPATNVLRPLSEALAALGRHQEAYEHLHRHVEEHERHAVDRNAQGLAVLLARLESGLSDEHELHVLARQAVADANRALREQAEQLERLSATDDLTGLHNRRSFRRRLLEEEARARRDGHDLVVALVDVDNFKRINDEFSHTVGDEVLVGLGELLKHAVRGSDVVARWGGEEFVMLLPGTSKEAGLEVAERARQRVEGHDWGREAAGLSVTVSVGVAALSEVRDAGSGDWVGGLVKLVDARLYAAKRGGRNRITA